MDELPSKYKSKWNIDVIHLATKGIVLECLARTIIKTINDPPQKSDIFEGEFFKLEQKEMNLT